MEWYPRRTRPVLRTVNLRKKMDIESWWPAGPFPLCKPPFLRPRPPEKPLLAPRKRSQSVTKLSTVLSEKGEKDHPLNKSFRLTRFYFASDMTSLSKLLTANSQRSMRHSSEHETGSFVYSKIESTPERSVGCFVSTLPDIWIEWSFS